MFLSRVTLLLLAARRVRRTWIVSTMLLVAAIPAQAQQVLPDSIAIARGRVLLAQAANDSMKLADAVHQLGLLHWLADSYDSALVHFIRARELREQTGDSLGLARAMNSIGSAHYQEGNYGQALESFFQSLAVRRAINDRRGIAISLTNIGKTYQDWKQYERAVLSFVSAVNAAESSGNAAALGYALHSLGTGQIDLGQYAEARASFGRSIVAYASSGPHRTALDSTSGWALNALSLGKLELVEGHPRRALVLFDSVLARALRGSMVRGEIEARLAIASAHLANAQPARARSEYERGLTLARQVQLRAMQLEALEGIARAEEELGNHRGALAALRIHRTLSDSIFNRSAAQRVAAMELELQASEARRTNAALVLAQTLQAEALGRQRLVLALSVLLLAFAMAMAALFWRFNRIARRQASALAQANDELGAANEDLRNALAEVRTLSGFIPICAHCKRVRDDDGYWKAVETYISSRSDASFSHAICHTCGPQLYGDDWVAPDADGVTRGAR